MKTNFNAPLNLRFGNMPLADYSEDAKVRKDKGKFRNGEKIVTPGKAFIPDDRQTIQIGLAPHNHDVFELQNINGVTTIIGLSKA